MQYLKFTYSFLQCEKMLPAPAVSGINAALGSCSVHCAAAPAPSRELCPDKRSCWGSLCSQRQLGLLEHHEHLENSPCASSASGPFEVTLVMKCTPRLRNSLGAKIRKKSMFSIWYSIIPHLQSWEQAHLLTQNRTAASRDCGTVLPPCPHSSQAVMCSGPRAFLLCLCLTQKGNKEQRWFQEPHYPSVPALQPGQLRGNILGIGVELPTSTGRPAKAEDSFPLPWQEGSSLKSLSCLWQVEELVPQLPGHRGWGKDTYSYYPSADGMFPAGSGSSLHWQTLTTQQGVPGGQQSSPCFLPSLVSLFSTCTSLTGISCSAVPAYLMPASMSSLSPLPSHLLATSLPRIFVSK